MPKLFYGLSTLQQAPLHLSPFLRKMVAEERLHPLHADWVHQLTQKPLEGLKKMALENKLVVPETGRFLIYNKGLTLGSESPLSVHFYDIGIRLPDDAFLLGETPVLVKNTHLERLLTEKGIVALFLNEITFLDWANFQQHVKYQDYYPLLELWLSEKGLDVLFWAETFPCKVFFITTPSSVKETIELQWPKLSSYYAPALKTLTPMSGEHNMKHGFCKFAHDRQLYPIPVGLRWSFVGLTRLLVELISGGVLNWQEAMWIVETSKTYLKDRKTAHFPPLTVPHTGQTLISFDDIDAPAQPASGNEMAIEALKVIFSVNGIVVLYLGLINIHQSYFKRAWLSYREYLLSALRLLCSDKGVLLLLAKWLYPRDCLGANIDDSVTDEKLAELWRQFNACRAQPRSKPLDIPLPLLLRNLITLQRLSVQDANWLYYLSNIATPLLKMCSGTGLVVPHTGDVLITEEEVRKSAFRDIFICLIKLECLVLLFLKLTTFAEFENLIIYNGKTDARIAMKKLCDLFLSEQEPSDLFLSEQEPSDLFLSEQEPSDLFLSEQKPTQAQVINRYIGEWAKNFQINQVISDRRLQSLPDYFDYQWEHLPVSSRLQDNLVPVSTAAGVITTQLRGFVLNK